MCVSTYQHFLIAKWGHFWKVGTFWLVLIITKAEDSGFVFRLGLDEGFRLFVMIRVRVQGWRMHYIYMKVLTKMEVHGCVCAKVGFYNFMIGE